MPAACMQGRSSSTPLLSDWRHTWQQWDAVKGTAALQQGWMKIQ
jgi:hypothetical protein